MLLLQHDVDCMQLKDKKYLGSPLHWSKNSDVSSSEIFWDWEESNLVICTHILLTVIN